MSLISKSARDLANHRVLIVPLKRMSVCGTYEARYLGFDVPRMELKIMATNTR